MSVSNRRTAARVFLTVAAIAAVGWAASQSVLSDRSSRMSDALPLYLYGAAWLEGLSPVAQASLKQVYADRGMDVGAALWSTLYPATVGPLFAPFALFAWETFTRIWGVVLLASGALVGAVVPRKGDRWTLIAGGVVLAAGFAPVAEAARLGQVNVLLALLCALGMLALHRDRDGVAGALFGLAAAIKLVPVFVALPFAWRHRKAVLGGLALGLPVLGLSFIATSPPEFVQALQDTARFQTTIAPWWMITGDLPGWALALAEIRHGGLGIVTVVGAGLLSLWRPDRTVLVGAAMAVLAWLGTDAVAFHVLYAPLYLPAIVWLGTWALEDEAPKWAIPVSLACAVGALGVPHLDLFVDEATVSGMLLGYAVWLGVLVRTGHAAWNTAERGPLVVLERWPTQVAGVLGLASMYILLSPLAAEPPRPEAVMPGGEIHHEGVGFVEPPEGERDLPQIGPGTLGGAQVDWTELSVVGRLSPGSRQALDHHLETAASRWTALGQGDLAESVPSGPLARTTVEELTLFLAAEGARLDELGRPEPLWAEWSAAAESAGR
ncbi:MAG: DUF2029 domain-containing protein [Proteobacteria bacterium]|nr:DUF2029 domain-containing protein [Pseudomonadota bacterium]MCP4919735.1 DUF2029 domain-containing protein [Pseudomonadota bacterium]